MKIIKHVKDLPKWFDLNKYTSTEQLDALGWLEQLTVRHNLLFWFSRGSKSFEELLPLLRKNPIFNTNDDLKARVLLRSGALDSISSGDDFSKYALGVHMLTVREYFQKQMNFDDEKGDYAAKFFKQFKLDWLSKRRLKYKCMDWIDQPVDAITSSHIPNLTLSVNLNLPDKLLFEQFEALIKNIRSNLKRDDIQLENNQKFEAKNLIKFAVLPYLDLKINSLLDDVNITNRVMADAIFPQGEGGEEVVRKTTKPLAESVLGKGFLEKLEAIAAHEKAERNKR